MNGNVVYFTKIEPKYIITSTLLHIAKMKIYGSNSKWME